MSQTSVEQLVSQIRQLSEEDRLLLESRLAELQEADWQREASKARTIAGQRGITQDVIDAAVDDLRQARR